MSKQYFYFIIIRDTPQKIEPFLEEVEECPSLRIISRQFLNGEKQELIIQFNNTLGTFPENYPDWLDAKLSVERHIRKIATAIQKQYLFDDFIINCLSESTSKISTIYSYKIIKYRIVKIHIEYDIFWYVLVENALFRFVFDFSFLG